MAWNYTKDLFAWTYVAFDSFEGLPEIPEIDQQPIWYPGDQRVYRRVVERGNTGCQTAAVGSAPQLELELENGSADSEHPLDGACASGLVSTQRDIAGRFTDRRRKSLTR